MGKIAGLTTSIDSGQTPIGKELSHFVHVIGAVAIIVGLIFFAIDLFMKFNHGGLEELKERWIESVIFLIGIIVANVPEGILPT